MLNFPLSQIWENPRAGSRQKIRTSLTEAAALEIRNILPRGKQGTRWWMGRAPRASYGGQLVQTVTWRLGSSDCLSTINQGLVQGCSSEAPSSTYYTILKSTFIEESIFQFMNSAETLSQSLPWWLPRVVSVSGKARISQWRHTTSAIWSINVCAVYALQSNF